ncbi:MAG: ferritin-like domain-containing protein [Flavobacteriales bacterium]|nr:ferritin-like domain-containing protein [Flavobacteriales bacterium]
MKSINNTPSKNGTDKSSKNGTQAKSKAEKTKPGAADGLRELFVAELKDIYWAEKALTKAIPKMIKNATAEELVEALTGHLVETREHVTRLEEVFVSLGEKAVAKTCAAMVGLIKEGGEIMEDTEKGMVRDAGIILAGQKIEHYEIATYGTLCSFAKTLGEDDAAAMLLETLNDEKGADAKLSEIAESFINEEAADEDDENEEEYNDRNAVVSKARRK